MMIWHRWPIVTKHQAFIWFQHFNKFHEETSLEDSIGADSKRQISEGFHIFVEFDFFLKAEAVLWIAKDSISGEIGL